MPLKSTLLVCSGGLDSVTLAYDLKKKGLLSRILTFNYNQKQKKEIVFAKKCSQALQVPFHTLDISSVGHFLSSSLTQADQIIPEGTYSQENMGSTVVPNRNVIFLSIAYGLASSFKDTAVALAIHSGDHFIYPDCRPEFIESFQTMQNRALEHTITLHAPYSHLSKKNIIENALTLNVPIEETWSCYKGDDLHCGRCATCIERQKAFYEISAVDPTLYQDSSYWKEFL